VAKPSSAPSSSAPDADALAGVLERIIFANEENH